MVRNAPNRDMDGQRRNGILWRLRYYFALGGFKQFFFPPLKRAQKPGQELSPAIQDIYHLVPMHLWCYDAQESSEVRAQFLAQFFIAYVRTGEKLFQQLTECVVFTDWKPL